ncbi:uncharacterized protein BX664DRAFT_358057 [Halteromyces radiatus]|uniref:uncharacterized protein n=1 Tax=Halteromyces radiatus TaxID=101107 RepID=UPI002220419B|nr:uncharacterized protein BX664DRAFT_358057 [Halteromyces radiatus]KAI8093627.1 hypothetical protein BX664DRAFT_358057 [Halteromyces radiatus]
MSALQLFSLKGKKAIVTGGGRGLGLEMSKALAGAGADVAMMYVSSDKTHDTAAAVGKEFNVQCKAYKADMGKPEEVTAAIDQIYKDFGHIDIFVANAGIAIEGPAETFSMDDWKRIFDVNVHGVFCSVQAAAKRMLEQGRGSIILISSMSGLISNRPQPHCGYNASKGAVTMMSKCLAQEWAQRGIRVNSINPGYMETEMLKDVFRNNPEVKEKWLEYTPMGRLGRPDELNGAVIYLASDASSYVTGSQIYIDGGYTCV